MHIASHFAYLDAGTGSLIIQSLIGIIAGISVFGRRFFGTAKQKISSLFKKTESSKNPSK